MPNSSKLPEERLAVLLSGVLTGMCIIVVYRQNKSLFDNQLREWQRQWDRLEAWLKERPWPHGRLWSDVRDAMDSGAIGP